MISRLRRGWSIVQAGWLVIVDHPKLLILPIFPGALMALSLFGPLLAAGVQNTPDGAPRFAVDLGLRLLMVFFDLALVFCVLPCFRGGRPSLQEGVAAAWGRPAQILGWGLMVWGADTLLSLMAHALNSALGQLGFTLGVCMALAWTLAIFFVAPVLVVEGAGPVDAVKRSLEVLRERWLETIGGLAGIILISVALMAPTMLFVVFVANSGNGVLMSLAALWCIGLAAAFMAVGTIFQTGVYLFSVSSRLDGGAPSNAFSG